MIKKSMFMASILLNIFALVLDAFEAVLKFKQHNYLISFIFLLLFLIVVYCFIINIKFYFNRK